MVYWLVLFSIVVHGLSIPALNLIYKFYGVKPIHEDPVPIRRTSIYAPRPANAVANDSQTFVAYNRFSRPVSMYNEGERGDLPIWEKNSQSAQGGQGGPAGSRESDADSYAGILEKARGPASQGGRSRSPVNRLTFETPSNPYT